MKNIKRALGILLSVALMATMCACSEQEQKPEAETTLPPPDVSSYTWDTVEPDPVDPTDEEFRVDYTLMYANLESVCTSSDRAAYKALTEAILERKESVSLAKEDFDRMAPMLEYSPLFSLLSEVSYDTERMSAVLRYAVEESEQTALLDALQTRCAKSSGGLRGSKTEYAVRLYRSVVRLPYSYDEDLGLLRAAAENKYSAGDLANLYAFLLVQHGIPAVVEHEKTSGTYWTAACPDGEWYHFLPAYESMDNSGACLWYFGMTDEDTAMTVGVGFAPVVPQFWLDYTVKQPETDETTADETSETPKATSDDTAEETTAAQEPPKDPAEEDRAYSFAVTCKSTRFDELRACGQYTIEDGVLLLTCQADGSTVRISLDK